MMGFARVWMERVEPTKFFTEPHYGGSPAVLARFDALTSANLRVLLDEAWRRMAARELIAERDGVAPAKPRGRRFASGAQ